jgi:transcriptional regulator with XRE-family HTH domain
MMNYYEPTPYDSVQIAKRIEDLLRATGWSLADLAWRSGVSEAVFLRWRTGEEVPPVASVCAILEPFGVVYSEIIHGLRLRSAIPEGPPSSQKAA